jgi:hypothetical protein
VNKPEEDEARTVDTFVAVFIAVTCAFGIAAPVLSVTVPEIVPSPAVCACMVGGTAITMARADTKIIRPTAGDCLQWQILVLKSMMTSLERRPMACTVATVTTVPLGSATVPASCFIL